MEQDATIEARGARTVGWFAQATKLSLISIDSNGIIEFVNPSACALFGYQQTEMLAQPITIIVPERMRGAHMAGLARVASGATPNLGGRTVEVSALRKDGSEFPIEITLSVWQGDKGLCAGAVIKDISERRERDARLMRLASQDTLTGLHNRHQFMSLLADRIASGDNPSVILIDLDGFKEVNDTQGHATGDALLQAVGVRISYLLSADAALARLGGDEFAVMVTAKAGPEAPAAKAARILDSFRKPFTLGGMILDLSASLGVALSPEHGNDAEELVASADYALYRAKSLGGRMVQLFDPSMRTETHARRELRDELRRALREGELVLYYQPQVRLPTGEITGFEALMRWNHPTRGLLSPATFLPALEQSALALEIGWWTLDEACRTIARLNADGGHHKVSVNLFPAQFRALNLRDRVVDAMQAHGVPPAWLELEITEQIALSNDEQALRTLMALHDIGVGVAFDDFGTGYASLSSLQRFPLTTLKIDRGFIRDIQSNPSDAAITRALVTMSHDLGLDTIAEGIETEGQRAVLTAMGCPAAQGYLFGRPMPEEDAVALVKAEAARRRDGAAISPR